jgi:hypothetical protein
VFALDEEPFRAAVALDVDAAIRASGCLHYPIAPSTK